ncbi:MAG: acyl-[acyl-carrier-protein]--UDP-N-acetylglucosamine O-acyltransferase [gamma proteobacterium symbiont of Ctena orbiculata]|nr:MAG: acyl-[acyl-carrier-protein]--UDP-N-acetylglucosamine O-acyltransferase [gamma proteobacterium symbiont of Ctena orbiculata]PVV22230.1 MAG: acyl-[acyl-carrier-protein]--UDP-N-acetylglucosamine O-acyltransferase [gamma proteobacterium symbiont of Ctena orbiculata]PVV24005.1 MAG: acyl-[acyl-carrier-protein]--UDP-N-acetylglucosamine O-acyltransferase [gamma proteobacterium symbiont of Ctena orbiculata]
MIDPRAVIDPDAELDEGVSVGPFTIIGAGVKIAAGTEIGPHVVIKGPTQIGRDNRIYQFASVGEDPQDMKYAGEPTTLEIGDRNVIREFATLHRGTVQDRGVTRIGNDNLLMAYIHVAHDCVLEDHIILANAASLGGHVQIGRHAILGGFTKVHQFCRVGAHSFSGMGSAISMDLPPYVMASGQPAKPHGINREGLSRRGFNIDAIQQIKRAYKLIYLSKKRLEEAREGIDAMLRDTPELEILADFLKHKGRGILR